MRKRGYGPERGTGTARKQPANCYSLDLRQSAPPPDSTLVHRGALDAEQGAQGRAAFPAQFPLEAQLGAGAQQAAGDHGQRQAALATGAVEQDPVELAGLRHAQDGAGRTVGTAGKHRGGAVAGVEDGAARPSLARGIDGVLGQRGEVAERAPPGLSLFPLGLVQQVAGGFGITRGLDTYTD